MRNYKETKQLTKRTYGLCKQIAGNTVLNQSTKGDESVQWRIIKGFEGYYEVSDTGLVRSVDRIVDDSKLHSKKLKGKVLKLCKTQCRNGSKDGYYVVNLRQKGTSNVRFVHRLVAEAFLPNPKELPTVNHKNGNKQDNRISNLEWASHSENNTHALALKLRQPRSNWVVQLSNNKVIGVFRSVSEASRITGIGRGVISHCVNHRINTAGGYQWAKIEKCNDYLIYESTTGDELPLEAQERVLLENIVCTDRNI